LNIDNDQFEQAEGSLEDLDEERKVVVELGLVADRALTKIC
jgi:hypothetical protein